MINQSCITSPLCLTIFTIQNEIDENHDNYLNLEFREIKNVTFLSSLLLIYKITINRNYLIS